MESVALMAVSLVPAAPAEALRGPAACSPAERRSLLSDVLSMKLRLGYEVVSETEFAAVVRTPSPRRWLGTRTGRANQHLSIAIDDTGRTRLVKSHPDA
jgi:hypothetical protein